MNSNYLQAEERITWGHIAGQFLLFMILPPIIAVPLIIYNMTRNRVYAKSDYALFALCIAAYLGAINATKMPGGDQVQYYYAYLNVPKEGFIGSLINIYGIRYAWQEVRTSISGEFMNGLYNYFGYYLTAGYYPLFVFLYTVVEYMLIFTGLYRFTRTMEEPHKPFVYGVIIISFFYLFFQYIFQIQKQFMAQAIAMYVLGTYAQTGRMTKGLWAAMVCAVFTHASTWLFVPFLVYKPLRKSFTKASLFFFALVFGYVVFYAPHMVEDFGNNNTGVLTYGLSRVAQSETWNDTTQFALVWSQILIIALPMAWVVYKRLWAEREEHVNVSHAFLLKIVMLLLLTITVMMRQPTAQYRYFMMLLAFMPFIYPFLNKDVYKRDRILSVIAMIMVVWFYWQFEKIVWHYAPEMDILIKNPLWLIIQGHGA